MRVKEERFREWMRYAPIGMALLGTDGRCLEVNPALCDMVGYSREELLGQELFRSIVHVGDLDACLAAVGQLHAGQTNTIRLDMCCLHKDSRMVWVQIDMSMVPSKGDAPAYFIAQVQDMTERQQVAQSLADAKEKAESAGVVRQHFLANVSHELRTPLNAVLGMARIGARNCMDAQSQMSFGHIIVAGEHLLSIINDILDFSKIQVGKFKVEPRPFRLADVTSVTRSFVEESVQQKGLSLQVDVPGDLPDWLIGDPLRLQQILTNLLSNAVKFTDVGEVRLRIERNGKNTAFQVSDTGIGIAPENIERLFIPFEQIDASSRNQCGTGLGLAISQRLAQLMGGKITVSSELGKGSQFELSLPLAAADIN